MVPMTTRSWWKCIISSRSRVKMFTDRAQTNSAIDTKSKKVIFELLGVVMHLSNIISTLLFLITCESKSPWDEIIRMIEFHARRSALSSVHVFFKDHSRFQHLALNISGVIGASLSLPPSPPYFYFTFIELGNSGSVWKFSNIPRSPFLSIDKIDVMNLIICRHGPQ